MKYPKTYLKYARLIEKGHFSERELISFRKAINGCSHLDPVLRNELAMEFMNKAETQGIHLDQSQQIKGLLWLKENTYKKNGGLRKSPVLSTQFDLDVMKDFSHFTCSGLYQASDNSFCQYVPIYRMYDTKGNWFEYACNMGLIEKLATGYKRETTWAHRWPELSVGVQ